MADGVWLRHPWWVPASAPTLGAGGWGQMTLDKPLSLQFMSDEVLAITSQTQRGALIWSRPLGSGVGSGHQPPVTCRSPAVGCPAGFEPGVGMAG